MCGREEREKESARERGREREREREGERKREREREEGEREREAEKKTIGNDRIYDPVATKGQLIKMNERNDVTSVHKTNEHLVNKQKEGGGRNKKLYVSLNQERGDPATIESTLLLCFSLMYEPLDSLNRSQCFYILTFSPPDFSYQFISFILYIIVSKR